MVKKKKMVKMNKKMNKRALFRKKTLEKKMNKKGGNETIWPRVIKLILLVLLIIGVIFVAYRFGLVQKVKNLFPDYFAQNLSEAELRGLGCDKVVAQIGISGTWGFRKQYLFFNDVNSNLQWDYENGKVISGSIVVADIVNGVVKVKPYFLDENSEEYLKNVWDGRKGDILVSIDGFKSLDNSFKLEEKNYLCKTDAQAQEFIDAKSCVEKCSIFNGECKTLNPKISYFSGWTVLKDNVLYYTKVSSETRFYLVQNSEGYDIYSKQGPSSSNEDKKVGEIRNDIVKITDSSSIDSLKDLDGTTFNREENVFEKIYKNSSCDEADSNTESSGSVPYGQLDCPQSQQCCVKENEDKQSDGLLKIDTFNLVGNPGENDINLLNINEVNLENGVLRFINIRASNSDSFCYILSSDKETLHKGYNNKFDKMSVYVAQFNPSLEKSLQFIAWNLSKKVIKRIKLNIGEIQYKDGIQILDGVDLKSKITAAKVGTIFYVSIESIWLQSDISYRINNFRITKTRENSISVEAEISKDSRTTYGKVGNYEWKTMNCNQWGWGSDLDIYRIREGKNSLRETVLKECDLNKFWGLFGGV